MDGVVFDFDGVLAHSMHQHAEAYRRVLAPQGVPVSDRQVFLLEGARSETVLADLAKAHGIPLDKGEVARLAETKQDVFKELGTPRLYAGAAELVRAAAEHTTRIGLVTGTRRENVERMLGDLRSAFSAVLSQEGYTHDKPHPEPFRKAAEAVGVEPSRLVAVENAPRGVASARAAGYGHVLAITTTVDARDLAEADLVVDDHEALRTELVRHLDRRS